MMTPALVEEFATIPAVDHRPELRAVLLYPESGKVRGRVAICCPHPFFGGTSENPVVVALGKAFASSGLAALIWEYAGIDAGEERSEVSSLEQRLEFLRDSQVTAARAGDLDDTKRVCEWLRSLSLGNRSNPLALAGYSYGGALALLSCTPRIPALAVSPPLSALPDNWEIPHEEVSLIRAMDDVALTAQGSASLAERSNHGWSSEKVLSGSDHFYRDALDRLAELARAWAGAIFSGT